MQSRILATTTAALIAALGVLPTAGATVPAAPVPAGVTTGDDGARDRMFPHGHSPRGAFLTGATGEYVVSPSGAVLYHSARTSAAMGRYRICGDTLVTSSVRVDQADKVSWRNLATGRTGSTTTDRWTDYLGPAPGGIVFDEQTPSALDKSSDIYLRAPDGSKRKLATVPGYLGAGEAICDTSGIAVLSKVFATATTGAKDVLSFVRFSGGAVTLATRPESETWPLRLVGINGTSVLWSVGQVGRTPTTLYRTDVGGARTTVVTVAEDDDLYGAAASATETLYSIGHGSVTTTTSLRGDGTRVAITGGPYSASTWLRAGSSWSGAGQDGMWSLAGTTASQVWQPPHVIAGIGRVAGADRYGTSTAVQQLVPAPKVVYVASGATYPDALSGGPAAAAADGTVVLTAPTWLPSAVRSFLTGSKPDEVVVLGGTGAVSSAVETALRGYAPTVRRLSGSDRYATAAAVSRDRFAAGLGGTVVVAPGASFADALSAGPAAAHWSGPLLLTTRTDLPASTITELQRLKPERIVVVGGTGVVSSAVVTALGAHAGSVQRVSGADRYLTAAAVSAKAFPAGASWALIASGEDFPDGISAGAVAGRLDGPVLLTARATLPTAVKTELARLRPDSAIAVGGAAVISEPALSAVSGVWWP